MYSKHHKTKIFSLISPSSKLKKNRAFQKPGCYCTLCQEYFVIKVLINPLLLGDGIGMAFGVFVPPIKKYLGTSTSSTAFIGSLHIGLCYLAAPFNLTLAKTFGFRKVAICGSLIVTAALITCGYIDTLSSLTILYGVCAGLATSAIYFCMLFVRFH